MKSARLLAAALVVMLLMTAGCHHRRPKGEVAPKQVTPVAELYSKGMEALHKHKPATARKYFDQIALREDAGEYRDKAAIATADSYYQEHTLESYAEAISRYQSFLAFHPTHPDAPYCQFKIGEAYFEEISTPDRDITPALSARDAFQALIENYPKSSYAAEAKQRVRSVNDFLAAHEIKVGDFYLKYGHPKGAIGRYRYAIEHFPTYWNMPLLYYRLGEALYRDNQDKEALLYFTRITQEVPGTVLSKNARKQIERIQKHQAAKEKESKVFKEPLVKPKTKTKHWWQFWKW